MYHYLKKIWLLIIESIGKNLIHIGQKFYKIKVTTNTLEDDNIEAHDIMDKRADIPYISVQDSIQSILKTIYYNNHILICGKDLDDVNGCIESVEFFKVFYNNPQKKIKDIINNIRRDIILVSMNSNLKNILQNLKTNKVPSALVVDNFGSSKGLITYNNIIKYLMEEYGQDEILHPNAYGRLLIRGKLPLDDLLEIVINYYDKKKVDSQQREIITIINKYIDEVTTVSGFICSFLENIPKVNNDITIGEIKIKIIDGNDRVLKMIELQFN